jgi:hypothetical protein
MVTTEWEQEGQWWCDGGDRKQAREAERDAGGGVKRQKFELTK